MFFLHLVFYKKSLNLTGYTEGGSTTVLLTSCLTDLEKSV
jgi:hypothetical protein